jgi:hypothetical protein
LRATAATCHYGGDRRRGGADCAGQAQGRCGEQETAALVRAQPLRELAEVPHLAEVDALLEQAVLVQRHRGVGLGLEDLGRDQLDGVVVGKQAGQPGIGDPLQQLVVAAVEAAARAVDELRIRVLLQLEEQRGEVGVEADQVALLHHHLVLVQHPHQVVVAHGLALAAEVGVQVDHHAAPLHPVLGEVLDAERLRLRAFIARPGFG